MKTLELKSFGPILGGQVEFGDLTVLVGPQASGKSLFVQMYKAIKDAGAIRAELEQYGFDWRRRNDPIPDFLNVYFGIGMQSLWRERVRVLADGKPLDFRRRVARPPSGASTAETVFLVPAQRVLALQDGWPRPFRGYAAEDSYCLRSFSEAIRKLMEGDWRAISYGHHRLEPELRRLVDNGVYPGVSLTTFSFGVRKQIILVTDDRELLRYNAWSAGQREFTPLLLAIYSLVPPGRAARLGAIDTIVVEEPEAGLHPRAIMSFSLLVLDLLDRGYRLILSTHSPVILDIVWAIRELRSVGERAAVSALKEIFGIRRLDEKIRRVFAGALRKEYRTYHFGRSAGGVNVLDISSLDPGDKNPDVSGWGGLSGFSGDTADIVGRALSGRRG
jgi:hypothetical protein